MARACSRWTGRCRGPIPWAAAECARAATVHVGGTLEEIAASEAAVDGGPDAVAAVCARGAAELFDPTRAPAGSTRLGLLPCSGRLTRDMTARIEAQIERFAPGSATGSWRARDDSAEFEA